MENRINRSRVISAAEMAVTSNVQNMTSDRVEALAGGHGMLNLAVYCIGNVIIDSLENGGSMKVTNANTRRLPMEDILEKSISIAKKAGCDSANAALLAATMMYFAGSVAQVGIPAGNRKLGALARIIAGVDRCGVAMIPTSKMNNKISGFPAVQAIYQAMAEGKLTEIDGRRVPMNIAGSAFYGHGALGEDYAYPQLAENGARIGTKAMQDALAGAGMSPHPFTCAIFGTAAILEIVHPDAEVSEEYGTYGKFNSAYLAGRTAAETAGLPMTLHIRGTKEEVDTARFIGDLGLILKDVGGPSVIGMMALHEIVAVFEEKIAGTSANPTNSPLGHLAGYAVVAMKAIQFFEGNRVAAANVVYKDRYYSSFNPEIALCNINILARKAEEIYRGPVTSVLINATEPAKFNAVHRRAELSYDMLSEGKTLADVVKFFDDERVATTERNASAMLSKMFAKEISIKLLKIAPGARRTKSKLALKYLAFDPNIDVEVTCDGKTYVLKGLVNDIIPKVTLGDSNYEDIAWLVPIAAPAGAEQVLAGNNILNIVIPAAVAAAMGKCNPKEAGEIAEKAAYVTAGIPGCKAIATNVAEMVVNIVGYTI